MKVTLQGLRSYSLEVAPLSRVQPVVPGHDWCRMRCELIRAAETTRSDCYSLRQEPDAEFPVLCQRTECIRLATRSTNAAKAPTLPIVSMEDHNFWATVL